MAALMTLARGIAPKTGSLLLEVLHVTQLQVWRVVVATLVVEEEHEGSVPGIVHRVQAKVKFGTCAERRRHQRRWEIDLPLETEGLEFLNGRFQLPIEFRSGGSVPGP
jgi:hypothetical protein